MVVTTTLWLKGEITEESLSIIAQDDPVTCTAYAKEHNLLHLPQSNNFKHIATHQKTLTRAINQTKIRTVRRSATYQFGYLIPRDYKHALELDKLNGNNRWYDATRTNWIRSTNTKSSLNMGEPRIFPNPKGS